MFGNSAISDPLLNTLSDICHISRPISLDMFPVKQFFCCKEMSLDFLSGCCPELPVSWRMHVFVHAVYFVLVATSAIKMTLILPLYCQAVLLGCVSDPCSNTAYIAPDTFTHLGCNSGLGVLPHAL